MTYDTFSTNGKAENLDESKTLFISSQNLLGARPPSVVYLKKNSIKQEKKFTSP